MKHPVFFISVSRLFLLVALSPVSGLRAGENPNGPESKESFIEKISYSWEFDGNTGLLTNRLTFLDNSDIRMPTEMLTLGEDNLVLSIYDPKSEDEIGDTVYIFPSTLAGYGKSITLEHGSIDIRAGMTVGKTEYIWAYLPRTWRKITSMYSAAPSKDKPRFQLGISIMMPLWLCDKDENPIYEWAWLQPAAKGKITISGRQMEALIKLRASMEAQGKDLFVKTLPAANVIISETGKRDIGQNHKTPASRSECRIPGVVDEDILKEFETIEDKVSMSIELDKKTGMVLSRIAFLNDSDLCLRIESLGGSHRGMSAFFGFRNEGMDAPSGFVTSFFNVNWINSPHLYVDAETARKQDESLKSWNEYAEKYNDAVLKGEQPVLPDNEFAEEAGKIEAVFNSIVNGVENPVIPIEPKKPHRCFPVLQGYGISFSLPIWDYCPEMWKEIKRMYYEDLPEGKRAETKLYIRFEPALSVCDGVGGCLPETKTLRPPEITLTAEELAHLFTVR